MEKNRNAFNPKNTIPTVKHGGGNIGPANGPGDLVKVNGMMNNKTTSFNKLTIQNTANVVKKWLAENKEHLGVARTESY